MTPAQYEASQQVAQAIDVLQEHQALDDSQSDELFCRFLEEIGSSHQDYWDLYCDKNGLTSTSRLI